MNDKEVIKVILGKPFKFNVRLGNILFRNIVRLKGVDYRRGQGFLIKDYAAIPALNSILSPLNIEVIPSISCIICNSDVKCEACEFKDECKKSVRFCVCNDCLVSENLWSEYSRAVKDIAFSLFD
jgi:hypothetical protein